jgi:hypothetical protein
MAKGTVSTGVLCDTGFLIRLNQPKDPLHANARGYVKFFKEKQCPMLVSTIALAEYAVRDRIANLPMRYLRVVPFNIDHAETAGRFASIGFELRQQMPTEITQRVIIPNDTKMFAQADVHPQISHYLTADERCEGLYRLIASQVAPRFQILPLKYSARQAFGELDLEV